MGPPLWLFQGHLLAHLLSPAPSEAARWAIMMAHGNLTSAHSSLLSWGFLLRPGETFWSACKLQRSRELTSGRPADFGWWRTDPCGKQSSCPEVYRAQLPRRSPEDRMQGPRGGHLQLYSFLFLLSGGCFLKINHQPTNPHSWFLEKLRLRHAIHFQIIVKN